MYETLKQNKNVMFHQNDLSKGDINLYFKNKIGLSNFKKTNALRHQMKKISLSMKQYDADFAKKNKKHTKTQKTEIDNNKNLRDINKAQQELNDKKSKTNNYFKRENSYYSKRQHLPRTMDEIDQNKKLPQLQLKNREKIKEKVYLDSFNENLKDKEANWKGNGYGTGHYLKEFMSINRQIRRDPNENFANLKNYLKMNYYTAKAEKYKDVTSKNNMWGEEGCFNADENANLMESIKNADKFDRVEREFKTQINILEGTLEKQKNEINYYKYKTNDELMNNDINRKKKSLQDKLQSLEDAKKNNNNKELEELYEQYILSIPLREEDIDKTSYLIGNKIKEYLKKTRTTSLELGKLFSEVGSIIDFQKEFININNAQSKFVILRILTEEESKRICEILRHYYGNEIRIDIFAMFIDQKIEKINPEDLFDEEDELPADNEFNNLRNKLDKEYSNVLINALKIRSAIFIQKVFIGYLTRKKLKSERIYLYILAKRICKLFRKNYQIKMKIKNEAAKTIAKFLYYNYRIQKKRKARNEYKSRWEEYQRNKKLLKKQNIKANLIQRIWREYKKRKDKEKKNFMTYSLLKSKVCFICKKNVVAYLCSECSNNHYCNKCFKKYHMRGIQRDHNYIKIEDLIKQGEKIQEKIRHDPELIDLRQKIKKYFKDKKDKMTFYQKLKVSLYVKNEKIALYQLKIIINREIEEERNDIKTNIIDYAMNYIVEGENNKNDSCIISINFARDLC